MATEFIPPYEQAGGAETKAYTLAENSGSVRIGIRFCESRLKDLFLHRVALLSRKPFLIVLQAVGLSTDIEDYYGVPRRRELFASLGGSSFSATVSRNLVSGTGYPNQYRYYLGGYALPLGYEETEGRDPYLDSSFLYVLSGALNVAGQDAAPTLVCEVF